MENTKLTEGNITSTLVRLALPIMATSFVQMAYNMMDMMWLGRLSTNAVAASGAAGFLLWLGSAIFMIPKIGAEVGVAQSYGKDDMESVSMYIKNTLQLDIVIALIYMAILISFRHQIIGFFGFEDKEVIQMAVDYLVIVSCGMVFFFLNPVLSGIYNGLGNSTTPFKINVIGLIVNMVLDPLMIMGIGPFPKMGIKGAALATIIAQFIVSLVFIYHSRKNITFFNKLNILELPDRACMTTVFKLGTPACLQMGLFAFIGMVIAKIIAQWGPGPVAVQNVGSNIESISWMTASGFSTALSAFVGQSYGAGKWDRIKEGYKTGVKIVGIIGIFATGLLILGAKPIFRIFIPYDKETLELGITYLKILGLSQFFITIEIASQGAFNGVGKTIPPSLVGMAFNALRIPTAAILTKYLGLNGVWWTVSISSILKGLVLTSWYIIFLKRQ